MSCALFKRCVLRMSAILPLKRSTNAIGFGCSWLGEEGVQYRALCTASQTRDCSSKLGLQSMGRMRKAFKALASLSHIHGLLGDALSLGKHCCCFVAAATSARTAGVVRAFLCKDICISRSRLIAVTVPTLATHRER